MLGEFSRNSHSSNSIYTYIYAHIYIYTLCFYGGENNRVANRELHQQIAIVVWKDLEPLEFSLNLADLVPCFLAQGSRGAAKTVTQIDVNKLVHS